MYGTALVMKRLLVIAVFLCVLLPKVADAGPALVGTGNNPLNVNNNDCSLTSQAFSSYTVGVETAPLLIVDAYAGHFSTVATQPCPTSVTDDNGGSWSTAVTFGSSISNCGCGAKFYSMNHPAGATVITVHWGAGVPIAANQCGYLQNISEVSGVAAKAVGGPGDDSVEPPGPDIAH